MYINEFPPVKSYVFEVHENVREVILLCNTETKPENSNWPYCDKNLPLHIFLLKLF